MAISIKGGVQERKDWFDTLKLFAIFLVFLTHFISMYHSEYFSLWHSGPSSWLLGGLYGKCGVAFLGVSLGYFAFGSKETDSTVYISRRYFYFFFCGLFINTLRMVLGAVGLLPISSKITDFWTAAGRILEESLIIGKGLFKTYWCMFSFFVASVLAYIDKRAGVKAPGIIVEIACFWIMQKRWIAICLIGALAAEIESYKVVKDVLSRWYVKVILFAIVFFVIKREESYETYLIDGLCSAAIILMILNSPAIQRVLSIRFFSSQGKNLMAIYLIHTTVYTILGEWLFAVLQFPHYWVSFLTVMIACWTVTVLLSYPLTKMVNSVLRWFTKMILAMTKKKSPQSAG